MVDAQAERQQLEAAFGDVTVRRRANDRLEVAQEQVDRLAYTAAILTVMVEITLP